MIIIQTLALFFAGHLFTEFRRPHGLALTYFMKKLISSCSPCVLTGCDFFDFRSLFFI